MSLCVISGFVCSFSFFSHEATEWAHILNFQVSYDDRINLPIFAKIIISEHLTSAEFKMIPIGK